MSKFIEVAVSQGLLGGRVVKSVLGYEYFSFQGIPYAKPPVGNLRFKPPQAVDKWKGTKDALREGNRSPQFDFVKKKFCGNEDCLNLNVYTPKQQLLGTETSFVPSIENKQLGNTFLSDSPRNLMKSGKQLDIPFITGITAHEGLTEIGRIMKRSWMLEELNANFESMMSKDMMDTVPGVDNSSIASKIKEFYFRNQRISLEDTLNGIIDLYSDIACVLPMAKAIALHKAHAKLSPVYCYSFSYDGPFGWHKRYMVKFGQMDWTPPGAAHCDELGYMFTNEVLGPQSIVPGSDEMKVVHNITSLWTNFAKTGKPSDDWLPVTTDSIQTLDIGLTLEMNESLEKPRLDFWKQIYSSLTF